MIWWAIGTVLFGVAALGLWRAFSSPAFIAGLTALAVQAAVKAIIPKVTKRMSPEEEAAWHAAERRGEGDAWLRKRRRQMLKK